MITVKHRRASEEGWLESDPIIPDGELALVSSERGYDIKIGDGEHRYSELAPIMGRHSVDEENDTPNIILEHRDHACYDCLSSLSIELADREHPDYVAMVSFSSSDFAPEIYFEYPDDIIFSGTDVADGYFCPRDYMRYTLLFWRDTAMNCHIRGVYVG